MTLADEKSIRISDKMLCISRSAASSLVIIHNWIFAEKIHSLEPVLGFCRLDSSAFFSLASSVPSLISLTFPSLTQTTHCEHASSLIVVFLSKLSFLRLYSSNIVTLSDSTMFLKTLCSFALLLPAVLGQQAPMQPPSSNGVQEYTSFGGNIYNNRWNYRNSLINSTTIGKVQQNCRYSFPLGVAATPVVLNNTVYFPTANGSFYAMNMGNCQFYWSLNVAELIYDYQVPSDLVAANCLPISRTSPVIDTDNNILYFGTQAYSLLIAVDLFTGQFLGRTRVNPHDLAIITMAPTFYNGTIFVGASSQEESATLDRTYPCCNFRGNGAAYTFDRASGQFTQKWNFFTLPETGWSGASVWSSNPSIDPIRNQVFFGVGNTYTYPPEYVKCQGQGPDCLPDDVWQESVLAVDIDTGKVNWRVHQSSLDGWVIACGNPGDVSKSPLCPGTNGPDADFAMAPMFIPASLGFGTIGKDSVVIGQKDGHIYSLDAVTGEASWQILIAEEPDSGWISWGMAADESQLYYTAINYGAKGWTAQPQGQALNNSGFGALDQKTGAYLWTTPCPENQLAYSPPGIVNDIIIVGQGGGKTENISGAVLALDKKTGAILQSIPVDTVSHGGIMAMGGFLVVPSGWAYTNPFEYGSITIMGLPDSIEAAKTEASSEAASASAAAAAASSASAAAAASEHAASGAHKGAASSITTGPSVGFLPLLTIPFALLGGLMVLL
jgi:outer membrane protein assembly factor BamB